MSGTRENTQENKWVKGRIQVAGLFVVSHIRMFFLVRLGEVRVNECPVGLEPSIGARSRRKATIKIRRNRPLRSLPLIPFFNELLNIFSFHIIYHT